MAEFMRPSIYVCVLSFGLFNAACDDPPAQQGIPPKPKKTAKATSGKTGSGKTPAPKATAKTELQGDPTDHEFLLKKAERELQDKAPKKAISTLRDLTKHHPKLADGYLKLATLLGADGKVSEATQVLEDGISKASDKKGLLEETARIQAQGGQIDKSNETIERLVEAGGDAVAVRLKYAQLLSDLGVWPDAFFQFERLEKEEAIPADKKVVFAKVLHGLKKYDRALTLLNCDNERPKEARNANEELRCGALRTAKGDYKQASKHLKQAQIIEATDRTYFYLAKNDYARGAFDEASRNFKKAGTLNEKALDWQIGYAMALRGMGGKHNLGKALRTLNGVVNTYGRYRTKLELQGRDPLVFLERAEIYLQLKEDKRAIADLDTGLSIAPGHTALTVAKAKALYYSRNTKKAMTLLRDLLKEQPTVPDANFFLARMHLASRENKAAIKFFELSLRHGKKNFKDAYEAHSSLIHLYKERNQQRKACDHMKQYLRTAPRSVTDREDVAEDIRMNCR